MNNLNLNKYICEYINSSHPGGTAVPIAGDASGRRFYRLAGGNADPVVIMEYGSPFREPTDDIILTRIFQDAGLPVARIVHASGQGGFLVLEDLGEHTLEERLARVPEAGPELYAGAVDLAARLAGAGTAALDRSVRSRSPALDQARFRFEMDYFLDHYYLGFMGNSSQDTHIQPLKAFLMELADQAAAIQPTVLCHRDFHSRNLVVSEAGKLAMVDIQDGRRGPLGYDLASLLWDAYVDLDTGFRQEMIRLFVDKTGGQGPGFEPSLRTLALQRTLKALGTFGYQISVMGRERYRTAIPRTLDNIRELAGNMSVLRPILGT